MVSQRCPDASLVTVMRACRESANQQKTMWPLGCYIEAKQRPLRPESPKIVIQAFLGSAVSPSFATGWQFLVTTSNLVLLAIT